MWMRADYVRLETDEEKVYYQPPARVTEEVNPEVGRFLALLRERSAPFRPLTGWKVGREDLRAAADVFAAAAREVFRVRLSVEDEDPTHVDAFVNTYLLADELRPLFDGARVKEKLADREYERFAKMLRETAMPAEESLYYFLGAYWGEWLVRHRGAVWMMHPPLQPLQAFPDMITANGTVGLLPFSQAARKLADPVGDTLAYKAETFEKEYLPPFPLIATLADRQEATLSLMPQKVRQALAQAKRGEAEQAMIGLAEAHEEQPDNLLVLGLLQQVAWESEQWEVAHQSLTSMLRQHPHARTFYNLGVFYAQFELLEEAVEAMRQAVLLHPHYGRAKLTMSALLAEKGDTGLAKAILQELLTEAYDSAIQEEAQALLLQVEDIERSGR